MRRDLSRLFYPKSVAFIGGNECALAVRRTVEFGFPGKIYAVHPTRKELGGVATVASVDAIDGPVDSAFIAVKREPTIEVVRALRAKGCGGAVIYASGFAETGSSDLQDALIAAADGMPLLGPNCYGYVNSLARAALWPDEHGVGLVDRGVAIITQSGNIACNLAMTKRALPLAAVITAGNLADVDMAQMVEALSEDDRITAIGLHIEGMADVEAFARAAAFARERRKPIVVLKTGRSEQGAKVALSHTSSLAGSDALYDALFRRMGIARLFSVTAFVETLKFLHHGGPLTDNRLVSLSCSGGEAALVADMAEDTGRGKGGGVRFPAFDRATRERVAATLNEYVSIDNPLDYHTFIWRQEDRLTATFAATLSGGFDVGMLILDVPTQAHMSPEAWLTTARAFKAAAGQTGARGAVVATLPECMPLDLADELAGAGVAPMCGLDDALSAFEAASSIGRAWARPEPTPAFLKPDGGATREETLSEFEAKALLETSGLRVPNGEVVAASEATAAADRIGYPVALKVSSAAIAHKTEAGGVVLNLAFREDVKRAAGKLAAIAPEVLVERMVTGAVAELIIGLKSDPQFGLALVIGAGGILAELLKDTAVLLLPADRGAIQRALASLKAWKLVTGYRGRSGDAEAVIDAVEAIARFAEANASRIVELDVNPLIVLPRGAVAADALLRMRQP
ncbi:MAG: acetate--CoA ligase family protein [Hyphomicrobium sp.]|uniref:acetate--CoA ligase family protein n=1 Tax=Hyphomicrobium sp. TaxID=82 RepID=UPI003D0FFE05